MVIIPRLSGLQMTPIVTITPWLQPSPCDQPDSVTLPSPPCPLILLNTRLFLICHIAVFAHLFGIVASALHHCQN